MLRSHQMLLALCVVPLVSGFLAAPQASIRSRRSLAGALKMSTHSSVAGTLQRRAFLATVASSAAILVSGYPVQASEFFDGDYTDPKHPGCPRNIASKGSDAMISGADGNPGCKTDTPTKAWKLQGKIAGEEIFVDFSPKGGPKDLVGKWDGSGIKWPDGNKWSKAM